MNTFETPVVHDHDDEAADDVTAIEACMTCLSDDAALLHRTNPEDEVADNMMLAEGFMRDMSALLLDCRSAMKAGIHAQHLVDRINGLLYRAERFG